MELLATVAVLVCVLFRFKLVMYGLCDVLAAAVAVAMAAVATATAAAAAAALNPGGTVGDVTSCDLRSR